MSLFNQPRFRIATLPTPLQFAANLSRELGGPRIYLKRDDLTGLAFGGRIHTGGTPVLFAQTALLREAFNF